MGSNLIPGGWLELQEIGVATADDDTLGPDTALSQACQVLLDGGEQLGRAFIDVWTLRSLAAKAGFDNLTEEQFLWPSNPWPKDGRLKELGAFNKINITAGIEGVMLGVGTRGLGWTPEDIATLAEAARADIENKKIHAYWPV